MSKPTFTPSWPALKADTHRLYGKYTLLTLVKEFIISRTFRPVVTLRLCQMVSMSPVSFLLPIFQILHGIAGHVASVDISWRTHIGPGFLIYHGRGLTINTRATIGKNVTLCQGIAIGQLTRNAPDGSQKTEYPVIEDGVWIGPNAVIVGGVHVGQGSRVAGGSFIARDIPPASVVAGNPAMIISKNCIPDIFNPAE